MKKKPISLSKGKKILPGIQYKPNIDQYSTCTM